MSNDFDFLHGSWDVVNRRLVKRLVASDEWDEFPATSVSHGFFGGAGSFDEITFPTKGWSGATVRMLDPRTGEWSIYWVNSRTGSLQPPVVGRFADGVGTFYGDDEDDGTPVRVRFIWSKITPTSAHWEQAFSTDGGRTWETNWTMAHTRRP
ncbi:hypothetical protein [Actinophytocola sp.]|uniref:hypothetical protein n=1 Tax=Actinophytocola sp. TaxID=1872138 RepID=UPI002D7E9774|nr:hypothetical protein [Actinophytocola sp.]HET9143303.1 hypothetical protein [Actinophytocola sp.]